MQYCTHVASGSKLVRARRATAARAGDVESVPALIESFAAFAASARPDFPPRARSMAVDAMIDCMGCIIAGLAEPVSVQVGRHAPRSPMPTPLMAATLG